MGVPMISKYVRIADELRQAIEGGEFLPGAYLPSETDLINKYKVSRSTVRQAVSLLANEGLVTPTAGIGTVVRETAPIVLSYTPEAPSPTWVQSNPGDTSARTELISAEWEEADYEIAELLGIGLNHQVLHRTRHMYRGNDIAQIHDQWIPQEFVDAIATNGDDVISLDVRPRTDLFNLLKDAGFPPDTTTETIGARMPTPGERDVMLLPVGVPVLTTQRTTRTEDGRPLETSEFASAADRCTQAFTVSLRNR